MEEEKMIEEEEREMTLRDWIDANPGWISKHGPELEPSSKTAAEIGPPPEHLITYSGLFWLTDEELRYMTLFQLESAFYKRSEIVDRSNRHPSSEEGDWRRESLFVNLGTDLLKLILIFVVNPFDANTVFDLFAFFRTYEGSVSQFGIFQADAFWKCLIVSQFHRKNDKYSHASPKEVAERYETIARKVNAALAERAVLEGAISPVDGTPIFDRIPEVYAPLDASPPALKEAVEKEFDAAFNRRCAYWGAARDFFCDLYPNVIRGAITKVVPESLATWNDAINSTVARFAKEMKKHQSAYALALTQDGILESEKWLPDDDMISLFVRSYDRKYGSGGGGNFLSLGGKTPEDERRWTHPFSRSSTSGRSLYSKESERDEASLMSETHGDRSKRRSPCDAMLYYAYLSKSLFGFELATFGLEDDRLAIVPNGLRRPRMGFVHDALWVYRDWASIGRLDVLRARNKSTAKSFPEFGEYDAKTMSTGEASSDGTPFYRRSKWCYDDELYLNGFGFGHGYSNPKFARLDRGLGGTGLMAEIVKRRSKSRKRNAFLTTTWYEGAGAGAFPSMSGTDPNERTVYLHEIVDPLFDVGFVKKNKAKKKKNPTSGGSQSESDVSSDEDFEYLFSLDQLYFGPSEAASRAPFDAGSKRKKTATTTAAGDAGEDRYYAKSVNLVGPFHALSWDVTRRSYDIRCLPFCFDFDDVSGSLGFGTVARVNVERPRISTTTNSDANSNAWIYYKTLCREKNSEVSESLPSFGVVVGCSSYDSVRDGRVFDADDIKITSEGKIVLVLDHECYLRTLIRAYELELKDVSDSSASTSSSSFSVVEASVDRRKASLEAARETLKRSYEWWHPMPSTAKVVFSAEFLSDDAISATRGGGGGGLEHRFLGIVDPRSLDAFDSGNGSFVNVDTTVPDSATPAFWQGPSIPYVTVDRPEIKLNGIDVAYSSGCNRFLFDASWIENHPDSLESKAPYRFEDAEDFENSGSMERFPKFHGQRSNVERFLGLSSSSLGGDKGSKTTNTNETRPLSQRLCFNPVIRISAVCGTRTSTCVALDSFHGNTVVVEATFSATTRGAPSDRDRHCFCSYDVIHATVAEKYLNFASIIEISEAPPLHRNRGGTENSTSGVRIRPPVADPSNRGGRGGRGRGRGIEGGGRTPLGIAATRNRNLANTARTTTTTTTTARGGRGDDVGGTESSLPDLREKLLFFATCGYRKRLELCSKTYTDRRRRDRFGELQKVVSTLCYACSGNSKRFVDARGSPYSRRSFDNFVSGDRFYRRFSAAIPGSGEGSMNGSSLRRVASTKEFDFDLGRPDYCSAMTGCAKDTDVAFALAIDLPSERLKTRVLHKKTIYGLRKVDVSVETYRGKKQGTKIVGGSVEKKGGKHLLPGFEYASHGIDLENDLCTTRQPDADVNGCKPQDEGTFYYEDRFLLKCYTGCPAPYVKAAEEEEEEEGRGGRGGKRGGTGARGGSRSSKIATKRAWHPKQFKGNAIEVVGLAIPNVARSAEDFPICYFLPSMDYGDGDYRIADNVSVYNLRHDSFRMTHFPSFPSRSGQSLEVPHVDYLNPTFFTPGLDYNNGIDDPIPGRWAGNSTSLYPDPSTLLLFTDLVSGRTLKYSTEVPSKTLCAYRNVHLGIALNGDFVVHALPDAKAIDEDLSLFGSRALNEAYGRNVDWYPGPGFACPVVYRCPLFATNMRGPVYNTGLYGADDPDRMSWYHEMPKCSAVFEDEEEGEIYVIFSRSYENNVVSRFVGVFPDYRFSEGYAEPRPFSACPRMPSRFEFEGFGAQDPNFYVCVKFPSNLVGNNDNNNENNKNNNNKNNNEMRSFFRKHRSAAKRDQKRPRTDRTSSSSSTNANSRNSRAANDIEGSETREDEGGEESENRDVKRSRSTYARTISEAIRASIDAYYEPKC